jgi:F-type H+-transporting ATPase subunit epsilon
MARTFKLSVVAPDRTVVEDRALSLIVPAHDGYMGILAGHAPMIVQLAVGLIEYRNGSDQVHFVSITGGFLEVDGENAIVLADSAQLAGEIDVQEAEEALERARRALRGEDSSMTTEEAGREIERAMTRIKLAGKRG